jgi:hypothetical protein
VYSLEHHVGRLVELRAGLVTTSDEYNEFVSKLLAIAKSVGGRVIVVTDSHESFRLPPSVMATVVKGMHTVNSVIERSAIWVPPASALEQQTSRAVRQGGNEMRRMFTATDEMRAWLAEVLTDEEMARLDEFIVSLLVPRERVL